MNKGIPGRHGFPMKGTAARTFFFGMRMSKDENDAIERTAQRLGLSKTDTVLYAISQLDFFVSRIIWTYPIAQEEKEFNGSERPCPHCRCW